MKETSKIVKFVNYSLQLSFIVFDSTKKIGFREIFKETIKYNLNALC